MRELVLTGAGRVVWRDADDPALSGVDTAVVRPIAVGVCDFDRAMIAGAYDILPPPIVLGHEIVAEVVSVGTAVRTVRTGDRVVVPMQVACGSCGPCQAGRGNSCVEVRRLSNYGLGAAAGDYGGGMTDLLLVPYADAMLVPVPAGLSSVDCVALGCNLVDAYRCVAAPLAAFPGAEVLVVGGTGHRGALYATATARVLGAGGVDVASEDSAQLAEAEALGARPRLLGERLRRGGYPVVVDLSLEPTHLAIGAAACAPDGFLSVPWVYPGLATPLPLAAMFRDNVTMVTGQPHVRTLIDPVLELIKAGDINSTTVPTEILDWDTAEAAYGGGTAKRVFVR